MPRRPHLEPKDLPADVARQFRSIKRWQAATIIILVCCVPLVILLQFSPPGSGVRSLIATSLELAGALAFISLIGLAIAGFRMVLPPAIEYLRHKPENPPKPTGQPAVCHSSGH